MTELPDSRHSLRGLDAEGHTRCVSELLLPELRSVRRVRASETSMDRLQARGRRKPRKSRR
jgi:hypothetical protein